MFRDYITNPSKPSTRTSCLGFSEEHSYFYNFIRMASVFSNVRYEHLPLHPQPEGRLGLQAKEGGIKK